MGGTASSHMSHESSTLRSRLPLLHRSVRIALGRVGVGTQLQRHAAFKPGHAQGYNEALQMGKP